MPSNSITIPREFLLDPSDGPYNAGWLSPDGEFQFAKRGHESHRSTVASGYAHLDLGWVRITCTPTRAVHSGAEVGCQMRSGQVATDEQLAAILAMAEVVNAQHLYGDCECVEYPASVDDVRRALVGV